MVDRHTTVDERDPVGVAGVPAELVVGGLDDHAGCAGRHHERRDAVVRPRRDRHHRRDVRAAVRDERLRTVEDPLVAVQLGTGAGRSRVGSSLGFGQPERPERPTGNEVREPAIALFVIAEPEDRIGTEADTGRQGDPHRLIHAPQLLDRNAQRCEVATAATPSLGEHDAEQPEVAHRVHHVDGEVAGAVPLGRVRSDVLLGEVSDRRPQQFVVRTQLPAHRHPTLPRTVASCRPAGIISATCCPAPGGHPRVLSPSWTPVESRCGAASWLPRWSSCPALLPRPATTRGRHRPHGRRCRPPRRAPPARRRTSTTTSTTSTTTHHTTTDQHHDDHRRTAPEPGAPGDQRGVRCAGSGQRRREHDRRP